MITTQIIESAYEIAAVRDLTFEDVAVLANYTEKEREWAKVFWNPAFNNAWMYLADELVTDWLGYSGKDAITHFRTYCLFAHYKLGVDYTEVYKDHELVVKYHSLLTENVKDARRMGRKRYFIVTGQCFKKIAIRVATQRGDEICDYFLKTEQLASTMKDILLEIGKRRLVVQRDKHQAQLTVRVQEIEAEKQLLAIESKEAIEARERELARAKELIAEQTKQLNRIGDINQELIKGKLHDTTSETLYVVTTIEYARQGMYKVGKTKNMRARNSTHNTSHAPGDEVFPVKVIMTRNATALEARIADHLQHFCPRDNKEFYKISFRSLSRVIDALNEQHVGMDQLCNEIMLEQQQFMLDNTISWDEGIEIPAHLLYRPQLEGNNVVPAPIIANPLRFKFSINAANEPKQSYDIITEVVDAYKLVLGGKKGSWSRLSKLLNDRLKPLDKQPCIPKFRRDIERICAERDLMLKHKCQ